MPPNDEAYELPARPRRSGERRPPGRPPVGGSPTLEHDASGSSVSPRLSQEGRLDDAEDGNFNGELTGGKEVERRALLGGDERENGEDDEWTKWGERGEGGLEDEERDLEREMEVFKADEGEKSGALGIEDLIARTVPSTDDPSAPTLTPRALLLGTFFCLLGASASMVFYFKSNAPTFSQYFIVLACYPLGHALASPRLISRDAQTTLSWDLPFSRPRFANQAASELEARNKGSITILWNPGEWSRKEAILASVIATSGTTAAYAADILAIMDLFFRKPLGAVPSVLLLITTQCIGFGFAGMLQSLLVTVPSMYWPSTLVTVQLFSTLYPSPSPSATSPSAAATSRAASAARAALRLTRSRLRVFVLTFLLCFTYHFLPLLFFPTLTSLATLCLIDNRSWVLRTLGSAYTGLGIGDLSFDWSSIGTNGPLYTPWWALANYFGGLIAICWVITPLYLLFNVWNARAFPQIATSRLYNSTFQTFDVEAILNDDDSVNEAAWDRSKPLLLSPLYAMSYGADFATLTGVLVHVYLWHRREIQDALARRTQLKDVHNTLMRSYRAVPQSWYIGMLALNFIAAIYLIQTTPLQLPIWALTLCLGIAVTFLVPIGIITAVSNRTIGLNVLTEFVAGFLMPGRPIGNVTFKCFGYMAMNQCVFLLQDLKLGWYTSIPPREMFFCQVWGTVLGALTNYVVLTSVIGAKRPYLDGTIPDPTGQWEARKPRLFYSASIIWGAVAPRRFFSGKYQLLYLGFPIGIAAPIILYLGHKRWPHYRLNKIVLPLFTSGMTQVPQNPTNIILSALLTAILSHKFLAVRYPVLHTRYVYVVSAALDAGTSITALTIYVLFGGLIWRWNGPEWWGNSRIDTEHCTPGS